VQAVLTPPSRVVSHKIRNRWIGDGALAMDRRPEPVDSSHEEVADNEESCEELEQPVHVSSLAAHQFQKGKGDKTERNALGDAEGHRHDHQG
jgi:hypothetical protein